MKGGNAKNKNVSSVCLWWGIKIAGNFVVVSLSLLSLCIVSMLNVLRVESMILFKCSTCPPCVHHRLISSLSSLVLRVIGAYYVEYDPVRVIHVALYIIYTSLDILFLQ